MNFRKQIAKNQRYTFLVILTYVLIMYSVGILLDIVVHSEKGIGFANNVIKFATFQNIPYFAIAISFITIVGVLIIHFFGHKLMMLDMEYTLIEDGEKSLEKVRAHNALKEMSISAGLNYVPKFYVIETSEVNAFASGWGKSNACVAVTTGLLERLNRAEIQSVIAHEVGHIIHGDSKLTMYVGVLSNVMLTVVDIFANIFYWCGRIVGKDSKEAGIATLILIMLNFLLPVITKVLYLYLSRTREYMADAAAVKLTGNEQAMISALEKISGENEALKEKGEISESVGENYRQAAYICPTINGLFSTHPKIEDRIKALNPNYYQQSGKE